MSSEDIYEIDFGELLEDHFADYEWNFTGVKKEDGELIPVPPMSTAITAIIETDSIETLRSLTEEHDINVIEPDHTRQYPDVTLTGGEFGDYRIALDIKTARRSHSNEDRLKSPMTLGSYSGYFQEPEEESPWTKFPYGSYDEHWILCFAHYWDGDADSRDMISGIEVIVGEKWSLASKTTGTGTTNHIGSIKKIPDLHEGSGAFDSEEEFEEYWRNQD